MQTMQNLTGEVGRMSGHLANAEGWRRRMQWGPRGSLNAPLWATLSDKTIFSRNLIFFSYVDTATLFRRWQ